MRDEPAAADQERSVTRRKFVGITVATGAALLAGKPDVILGASTATSSNMATNPTFNLGGDFTVNRLGFGAMRVTGKGILRLAEGSTERVKSSQTRSRAWREFD